MRYEDLRAGDILRDPVGRIFVLVRNEDTGELFGVSCVGFGDPDIQIHRLSRLGAEHIHRDYEPIDTAWQREHGREG